MHPPILEQPVAVTPLLWDNFRKWWTKSNVNEPLDPFIRYEHHPVYSALSAINNTVICVIDIPSMKYLYTSPNFSEWTGLEESSYVENGVKFVFGQLHDHDQHGAILFSGIITRYFKGLPDRERKYYKAFWDYRLKNAGGQYTRIVQRDCVLKYDPDGNILELAVFCEKIDNITTGEYQRLRLTNGFQNEFYYYDHHRGKAVAKIENLSKRELQIAQLVARSWPLKNIADELTISFNTVKAHSQNIMKKLKVRTSVEMVTLLRVWGFI